MILSYFDPSQEVTLLVDASTKGLGAAKNGRQIAFTSKVLTGVEARYANKVRNCYLLYSDVKSSTLTYLDNHSQLKRTINP